MKYFEFKNANLIIPSEFILTEDTISCPKGTHYVVSVLDKDLSLSVEEIKRSHGSVWILSKNGKPVIGDQFFYVYRFYEYKYTAFELVRFNKIKAFL